MNALNISDVDYTPWIPESYDEGIVLPQDRRLALEALKLLGRLEDNWNGYGAVRPSDFSAQSAENFIRNIPLPFKAPNQLDSDEDGHIILVWSEKGERLIITIEPLMIHFSIERNDEEPICKDDIFFDGTSVPKEIKECLPKRRA